LDRGHVICTNLHEHVPVLTLDAHRCTNQRRGFELPICAYPLSKVTSIVQPYCQPLSRYSDRKDTEGTSLCIARSSETPVIEEPPYIVAV